jgi:hypothetical protein
MVNGVKVKRIEPTAKATRENKDKVSLDEPNPPQCMKTMFHLPGTEWPRECGKRDAGPLAGRSWTSRGSI